VEKSRKGLKRNSVLWALGREGPGGSGHALDGAFASKYLSDISSSSEEILGKIEA
jgi:hypothetical protein